MVGTLRFADSTKLRHCAARNDEVLGAIPWTRAKTSEPEMSVAVLPPLAGTAEQEHTLLAEHVPEPPGQIEPQRTAVIVERDRALHLHMGLVAELDEILDGAE